MAAVWAVLGMHEWAGASLLTAECSPWQPLVAGVTLCQPPPRPQSAKALRDEFKQQPQPL